MAGYTKAYINHLSLNQLTDPELDDAVDAFNGFRTIFGRAWIDDYFKGAQIPGFVRAIMEMWGDFRIAQNLSGATSLERRWQQGIREQGVNVELRILAQLSRVGFEVEVEPQLPVFAKKPDARIRVTATVPVVWTASGEE
jgi:hypothetical protein